MLTKEELDTLSREQLIALLIDDSKNVIAMDGVWFQAIEKEQGMDSAMHFCEQSLWIIPEQFFPIFTLTATTERKYPYD